MSSRTQQTRRAILAAAWRRMEAGESTRLADIASEAGVSRQAVYNHFASRGGLLLALVEHVDAELGLFERIQRVRAVADPADRLVATVAMSASFEPEVEGIVRAMVRQAAQDPEVAAAIEDRMVHRRAGLREVVALLAEQGRLAGDFTVDEVVDLLWEAGAPTSYQHLVVERGWAHERWSQWLVQLAEGFVGEAST